MIKKWSGVITKYDLMVITRSPIVHLLFKVKNSERLEEKMKLTISVEAIDASLGIRSRLKNLTKVNGLVLINTSEDLYRPLLMETAERLRVPIVVLHNSK